ncbi:MAG: hypothetical protein CBC09_05140 [Cellvibrionales bacterium TMED49]|nr:hypothetical protein [Porticoccaceae bacterium]OUU38539.1 MAG: hypothetical protein CBC09_05140 [Cellvibrionales bacterium TMED49]
MLDSFRGKMRGVSIFIVIVIGVIFTFTGIGSISLGGAGSGEVATVNGEAITEQELLLELQRLRNRIRAENSSITSEELDDNTLRPIVLKQLIGSAVASQNALNQGMAVSTNMLNKVLMSVEAFQTDEKFDEDRYRYFIRNRGQTNSEFKLQLTNEMVSGQLFDGYRLSGFITDQMLSSIAELVFQTRSYYYLTVPRQLVLENIEIPETEIKDFYAQNGNLFQSEEQVSVDFIEISAQLLKRDILVEKSELVARFRDEAENFIPAISRRAAHILLPDLDSDLISEIMQAISIGESFEDLAEKFSTDAGSAAIGGDLGFTDGSTFPESFERALEKLSVGDISDPVPTESGVHIIKLLEVQQSRFQEDEQLPRIEREIVNERIDSLLNEKLATLRELSFNAESMTELAEQMDAVVSESSLMTRAAGDGIGSFKSVRDAAFSDDVLFNGYASEVLEIEPDRFTVVKLNRHIKTQQKEYSDVSMEIKRSMASDRADIKLNRLGQDFISKLESGETVEQLAQSGGFQWQVVLDADRTTPSLDSEVNALAFSVVFGGVKAHASFLSRSKDLLVITVYDRKAGDYMALSIDEQSSFKDSIASSFTNRELESYHSGLIEAAKVRQ